LAADNKLNEAIDKLLVLEKQTRAVIIWEFKHIFQARI
jgi:hypothetical protein